MKSYNISWVLGRPYRLILSRSLIIYGILEHPAPASFQSPVPEEYLLPQDLSQPFFRRSISKKQDRLFRCFKFHQNLPIQTEIVLTNLYLPQSHWKSNNNVRHQSHDKDNDNDNSTPGKRKKSSPWDKGKSDTAISTEPTVAQRKTTQLLFNYRFRGFVPPKLAK